MNVLERDYYTIEAIELMPEASQRDLAKYTGMSLGKVNYCLKELAQKGWIKAQEIQRADGRWAGLYLLTAKGRAAQNELTHNFLAYKMGELEKLSTEINRVHQKIRRIG